MEKIQYFQNTHYQRHNQRRQEHLANLGLPLSGKTVLEVGAGIGDHTSFFLDRNCSVTSTDGRLDLVNVIKERHPAVNTLVWDMEVPPPLQLHPHQVVYCYGLLYHVQNPDFVLAHLSTLTTDLFLLETCVSFGEDLAINVVDEYVEDPTQALSGKGCRPTRPWLFAKLKNLFPYVYVTNTQPWHEEFPIDWNEELNPNAALSRSVFVASRQPLLLGSLSDELINIQTRC
jgi:hypothetical protein